MQSVKDGTIEKKIIFAGLDNAGKTSSLIALRKKYNFYERVENIIPTIKIDFSSCRILDKWRLDFWDMGGQAKYRAIYVENSAYFLKTDFLFYIIDIQDENRYLESITYLGNILEILREKDYKQDTLICFHKLDPNIRQEEKYHIRIKRLINLIQKAYPKSTFKFFLTSIYDISSLSLAVGYALEKFLNLEAVQEKIRAIATNYECEYVYLFTDAGVIIADYYYNPIDSFEFEETIKTKVNENLIFFQNLADRKVKMEERVIKFRLGVEYVKKFVISTSKKGYDFFLGIICAEEKLEKIKEEIKNFPPALEEIFK
ncbi:MAG: ADP-ribosylation factor-like protein [Promethearchaeota archaeon]